MVKKKSQQKTEEKAVYRPPIVTLMGHVDHGKTSILDAVRKSKLTSLESGGITQHIGAYTIENNGKKITFIDTPGHEAFSQMRARGGAAADIVILVVAADDGVMPQTKEAIMHAKAANVPIIVAINKCDLPSADIMRVKRQLAENNIPVEGFGGDVVAVEVSALKGTGINELLDVILLIAEMNKDKLSADPNGVFEALVIESRHDPKKGIMVSAVVKDGTLNLRDEISAGEAEGKVRSLSNSLGKVVKSAVPGDAVEILGFSDLPQSGDVIKKNEEKGSKSSLGKESETSEISGAMEAPVASETPIDPLTGKKILNLLIKADTAGTCEAIVSSINKLKVEEAIPNILLSGAGDAKESDVLLASSGRAVIMAFRVNVPASVLELAKSHKVIIREHEIIYALIEEVEDALQGVLEIEEAKVKGKGLVIKVFTIKKSNMKVAGTLVEGGRFKVGSRIGIFREDNETPVYVSRVKSLHIGAGEVNEAKKGEECGILLKPAIDDIQLDDVIEIL